MNVSTATLWPDGACLRISGFGAVTCALGIKGCARRHVVCPCGRSECNEREEHARIERAAIGLYTAMPSEPNHCRSGVWWHELSETTRRSYRVRATTVLRYADG